MPVKIHGIIQCRDEWGMAAAAIAHALIAHVDVVHVLDHASTDETAEGLKLLQQVFPGRIQVTNLAGDAYNQIASSNLMLRLTGAAEAGWIYFFDADEFLIVRDGLTLKYILGAQGPDTTHIGYGLSNYAAPRSFDARLLDDYKRIRFRCSPRGDLDENLIRSGEECFRAVYANQLRFFDLPFPPKVIFRNVPGIQVGPGAHHVAIGGTELPAPGQDERLFAAHLSLTSREKLRHRAAHGFRLQNAGRPLWYGWQNQLLYRLSQEGRLEEFWDRHALPDDDPDGCNIGLTGMLDDSFARAVEPALDYLRQGFGTGDTGYFGTSSIPRRQAAETAIPLSTAVAFADTLLRQAAELNAAQAEAAHLGRVLEVAQAHLEIARGEAYLMRQSSSWRLTAPLRAVAALFRKPAPG